MSSDKATINSHGFKNYFSDSCLVKAGGESTGTLGTVVDLRTNQNSVFKPIRNRETFQDFYQIHTYSNCQCPNGSWTDSQETTTKPYLMLVSHWTIRLSNQNLKVFS